jgi:hypothetical protein
LEAIKEVKATPPPVIVGLVPTIQVAGLRLPVEHDRQRNESSFS